jgi:hypothetical protein
MPTIQNFEMNFARNRPNKHRVAFNSSPVSSTLSNTKEEWMDHALSACQLKNPPNNSPRCCFSGWPVAAQAQWQSTDNIRPSSGSLHLAPVIVAAK